MKISLVSPAYDIAAYMGKLSKVAFVFPPVGLMYIGGSLRESGFPVDIYDFSVASIDFLSYLREKKPDVIGITCQTALVYSTLELCKTIKSVAPSTITVIGGVHVNLRPEDLISSPNVDYCVRGEGEITMVELVKALDSGADPSAVPGVVSRKDGQICFAPDRPPIKNLDDIPFPALDMVEFDKYKISPDIRLGDRTGILLTSRGCPFDCIFCCNRMLTEGKWRSHTTARSMQEVENQVKNYGVDHFFMADDNFCVNKKHTRDFCQAYIDRGYAKNIFWWAEARVDCVNEEILQTMYNAGCRILSFGLESGTQRILDLIKKNISLERSRQAVEMARDIGISVRASFILGLPTETREETLKTIEFAKTIKVDQVRFALATPFPGTKLWDIAVEEGAIDPNNVNWLDYSLMAGYSTGRAVYIPKGQNAEDLAYLQRKANADFYLRPGIILMYLRRINSWSFFKQAVKGFFTLLYSRYKGR